MEILSHDYRGIQLKENEVYFVPQLQTRLQIKNIVTDSYKYTKDDSKQINSSKIYQTINIITTANVQSNLSLIDKKASTISVNYTSERLQ